MSESYLLCQTKAKKKTKTITVKNEKMVSDNFKQEPASPSESLQVIVVQTK